MAANTPDARLRMRNPVPGPRGGGTYAVLAAVSEHEGVSNREVSDLVHVADQGQISRLMARIDEQGLVENAGGRVQGVAKAWRLTPRGEAVVRANRPRGERIARTNRSVGERAA